MIDLIYSLVTVPVCAALASICLCRLNTLNPHQSRWSWVARYLVTGSIAAGVGFEALMHPEIFTNDDWRAAMRVTGLLLCSALLYTVLQNSWRWKHTGTRDYPPSESNRAPLGEL
jgi:hypothetical protein